jgi:hypothetical protein
MTIHCKWQICFFSLAILKEFLVLHFAFVLQLEGIIGDNGAFSIETTIVPMSDPEFPKLIWNYI